MVGATTLARVSTSVVEVVVNVLMVRVLSISVEYLLNDLFVSLVSLLVLLNLESLDQVTIHRRNCINQFVSKGRHKGTPARWQPPRNVVDQLNLVNLVSNGSQLITDLINA